MPRPSSRHDAAVACLVGIALAVVGVPGLHVLVHASERAPSWRIQAASGEDLVVLARHEHRDGRSHVEHRHDRGHGHHHDPDRPAHGHQHDRGGSDHGSGALEHLGLALLSAAPVAMPVPFVSIEIMAPAPLCRECIAAPMRGAHLIRGPPAARDC